MPNLNTLIEAWRTGDEGAAEALYNHCREQIFRLAYGLLGNTADAEEVAQDVLAYALMNIARYDPKRASFTTWLHTITVSRCRDRQRRKRLPRLSLTGWLRRGGDLPDPTPNQERNLIRLETRSEVWQAVQDLKPQLREAILLRYWAGHSYRDMAEILGCPAPTAQSRVRAAYQQLRSILGSTGLTDLLIKEDAK